MIVSDDGEQLDAVLKAIPVNSGPRDFTRVVKAGLDQLEVTYV